MCSIVALLVGGGGGGGMRVCVCMPTCLSRNKVIYSEAPIKNNPQNETS